MAAFSRALSWFRSSRLRIAGGLGAIALVALALVVLRSDDHGGENVDAASLDVRAGTSSTTTTAKHRATATTTATDSGSTATVTPPRPASHPSAHRGNSRRPNDHSDLRALKHARTSTTAHTP